MSKDFQELMRHHECYDGFDSYFSQIASFNGNEKPLENLPSEITAIIE